MKNASQKLEIPVLLYSYLSQFTNVLLLQKQLTFLYASINDDYFLSNILNLRNLNVSK